jgi:hypothetical protein
MEMGFVDERWMAGEPIVEVGLVDAVEEAGFHVADSLVKIVRGILEVRGRHRGT